jgi:hypothetical protein
LRDIFISIVGCDEDFIGQTVRSAVENSSNPDRLKFGVVEQRSDENFSDLSSIKNIIHEKILSIDPIGAGSARSKAIKLYNSEEFILITDAHMVFKKGWDENLIRRHGYIEKTESYGFVISQHLPTATLGTNKIYVDDSTSDTPSSLYFDGLVIRDNLMSDEYKRQYPITCQFIFGRGASVLLGRPDPRVYYLGEESLLSLLYYLNRIKIFSIDYNPMHHLVKQGVNIGNDWRKKADPHRMAKDFEILYKVFYEEKNMPRSTEYNKIIKSFKEDSGLDISCVFNNLNIKLDDPDKLNKVKKRIVDEVSNNNFDTSVFSIIASIASLNGV